VGVKTPIELGGSINVKGRSKTQAIVPHLLHQLPPASCHVFLDNLFTSTSLFELLRNKGLAATGTRRRNAGVVQSLLDKKDADKGENELGWGTQLNYPVPSGKVLQTGWKDIAFAFTMTTFSTGKEKVIRKRKRPRESSSKAKTARKPFGNKAEKKLPVPESYDAYNHNIGGVVQADQLKAHNNGERLMRRGAAKVLYQFLLNMVLVNIYQILKHLGEESSLDLTSQDDLRDRLIVDLLALGKKYKAPRKKRSSGALGTLIREPPTRYNLVKAESRRDCVACKGRRFSDEQPKKRAALVAIAASSQRNSARKATYWACKECNIALCQKGYCFDIYHEIE
jgi:hypothetical protein